MEKLVPLDYRDAARAFNLLPGSDIQKALHNEIVKRIEQARTCLESVSEHSLGQTQGAVTTLRQILAVIHSNDSNQIKELYARTSNNDPR